MSGLIGGAGSRSGIIGETEIDYEEGLFTGTFEDESGDNAGMTGSQTAGFYTKIGRTVTISGRFEASSISGMGGNDALYLTGLPFPPNTTSYNAMTAGAISHASGLNIVAKESVGVYTDPGSGRLKFKVWASAAGNANFSVAGLSADGAMVIGMTYQT